MSKPGKERMKANPLRLPEAPGGHGAGAQRSFPLVPGKGQETGEGTNAHSGLVAAGSSQAMSYSDEWLTAWIPSRARSHDCLFDIVLRGRGAGVKLNSTPRKPSSTQETAM